MHHGAEGAQPGEEPATTKLTVAVTTGRYGTVLVLSGEADVTTTQELSQFLAAELSGGAADLTIDMSGLRFADSATIATLLMAARTLRDRGGKITLLRPRLNVARVLSLTGADTIMTVRGEEDAEPGPEGSTGGPGGGR
jgi:anti-anti-sigma factor